MKRAILFLNFTLLAGFNNYLYALEVKSVDVSAYLWIGAVLLLPTIILILFIRWKLLLIEKKKAYIKNLLSNSFIWAVGMLVVSYMIVNVLFRDVEYIVTTEKETPHINLNEKLKEIDSIEDKLFFEALYDTFNLDIHYEYITTHFAPEKRKYDEYSYYHKNEVILHNYLKFSNSENHNISETGNFGLVICFLYINLPDSANIYYEKLADKNQKYINYSFGKYYHELSINDKAEFYFLKEIMNPVGLVTESLERITSIYLTTNQDDKLYKLLLSKRVDHLISQSTAKRLYFENFNLNPYTKIIIQRYLSKINKVGFIAAFLILLVWFIYIVRIDKFEPENGFYLALTFLLGMLFSFGAFYYYDFYGYILHFNMNGKPLNDFLYCIFGIGFVEELVKFIPVFIILRSRAINEPFDFILYACISALGFAFIENMMYFNDYSGGIIHARSLTSVVGHMIDSSIVAYGLVLCRYKYKKNCFLIFILFLLIASTTHGLYDYILFYSFNFFTNILFIVYFLYCVRIWILLMNNALNNSPFFDYKVKFNLPKLQLYLIISLTGILIFEYFIHGIKYGNEIANQNLKSSLISGSFLILFLSSNLSKFDFIKGHWRKIRTSPDKYNVGVKINPYLSVIFNQFFLNKIIPHNIVGMKISIESLLENKALLNIIQNQIQGVIIDRKVMFEDDDRGKTIRDPYWFVVKLEKPLNFSNYLNDKVIIRFQRKDLQLDFNADLSAYIAIIPEEETINETYINRGDFKFYGTACINKV